MSITSDIRSYADTAVNQGKHALNTAQTQLNDVSGQAGEYVGKYTATARDSVQDIAGKAGEAVNIDAIKSAIEPYVAQAKEYGRSVTDRAEGLFADLKGDKRVSKIVDTASSVSGVVVETVQERVVKPVQTLTGLGTKPATKKPSPTKAAKQATTRPGTKPTDKPAAKPTARKTPAKRVSTTPAK